MPYLPINYYPKNSCIELKESERSCFYCLIDNSDIIYHAIIRIYNYITNELIGVIYMSENGKIYMKSEMSSQDYEDWLNNNFIIRDSNDYSFNYWTDNENAFPIIGGKEESSILYVTLDNQSQIVLKPNKKYIWDIEVFDKKNTVWIFDGYFNGVFKSLNFPKLKLYPNEKISNNDIIKTEKGNLKIKEIVNEYYENEFTSTLTKITTSVEEKIFGDKKYYGYYRLSPNNIKLILPEDLTDLKLQLDIFYLDIFYGTETIQKITDGHIGFLDYKTKIVYCSSDLLTESTNMYSYIYRDYQTFIVDDYFVYNNLNEGDFYEVYSQKVKSYLNYFSTIDEVQYDFYTYDKNQKINFDNEIILNNSYQQFFCKIVNIDFNADNIIDWSQWIIYDKNGLKIYESDKKYNPNIFFEYYKFFENEYNLELIIHFKNNLKIILNRHFYINHIKNESLVFNTNVNYDNRCVELDISNVVQSSTPIVYNKIEDRKDDGVDWFSSYEGNGLFIKEDYCATWYLPEQRNLDNQFLVKCKLGEIFEGEILTLKSRNFSIVLKSDIDGKIYFNNELVCSIYDPESSKPYLFTSSSKKEFLPTQDEIEQGTFGETTVGNPQSKTSVTQIDFFDFFNYYDLIIKYHDNSFILQFIDNNSNIIKNIIIPYDVDNIALSQIILNGNINWYSVYIDDLFNLNFEQEKLNLNIISNTYVTPGFYAESILIYRINLSEKEVFNETFIGKINFDISYDYENKITHIRDYGVGGNNKYKYIVMPVYRNQDVCYVPYYLESFDIETNWYELCLYGTKENNNNSYLIDNDNKWYFMLDIDDKTITFNSDRQIQNTGSELPKIATTRKNYMSGTIKCKIGQIINEYLYINDNIKYLYNFLKFANDNNIKILKLKNNLIIPVNIQLNTSSTNHQLIDAPSEISFTWIQVEDIKDVGLYEIIYNGGV